MSIESSLSRPRVPCIPDHGPIHAKHSWRLALASRSKGLLPMLTLMMAFSIVPPICAQKATAPVTYTTPLATGVRLDPVGRSVDLGSRPIASALAPGADRVVRGLRGCRDQGIQAVCTGSQPVR